MSKKAKSESYFKVEPILFNEKSDSLDSIKPVLQKEWVLYQTFRTKSERKLQRKSNDFEEDE